MKFIKEEYLFENATKKALANLTVSKNNRLILSSDLDDHDDEVWEAYLNEDINDEWDKAWETKFGPSSEIKIMSAEDTLKELNDMKNFKFRGKI